MAHTPHIWTTGETIAAAPLNALEQDLAGALAVADIPTSPDLRAAFDARYARPRGNTVAYLGDSITAYSAGVGPYSGSSWVLDSKGLHNWANILLRQAMNVLINAGKGGDTTAGMLARVDAEVLALNPAWAIVLGGTNDAGTSITATTTIANLQAIYGKCLMAGANVAACTIPPNAGFTTAQMGEALKVNRWIRDYARSTRGIVLADIGAAIADPSTGPWRPLAGMLLADGTHPTAPGAARMGRVLADALRPYLPSNHPFGSAANDPTNLLANPTLYGTGTALPASWNISGGGASIGKSYIASSDGFPSSWLQLAVPAGGNFTFQQNITVDGATLSVGDVLSFAVEFQCDSLEAAPAAHTQGLTVVCQNYNGASFLNPKAFDTYWDSSYDNVPFPGTEGGFLTPPLAVAAGTQIVQVAISVNGGGNYRFRRASLRKV